MSSHATDLNVYAKSFFFWLQLRLDRDKNTLRLRLQYDTIRLSDYNCNMTTKKYVTLEVEGARKTRKEGVNKDMDDFYTKLTDAVDRSKWLKTIRKRNWSD